MQPVHPPSQSSDSRYPSIMQQRTVGRSILKSSELAYGCWRLAGSEGSESNSSSQYEHGVAAVLAAFDAGFTFFDLADIYGGSESERIFGAALRSNPGLRRQISIATKCGIRRANDPGPQASYRYDFSADHILRSVEGSLGRMGIETIDLLMLHRPDYLMLPTEVAEAFDRLRTAGKVLEFGVSNFNPSQVQLLQQACPMPLVVNQVEISLNQLKALEDGTLDQCLSTGMTPMAWSPLAKGALVSNSLKSTPRGERLSTELDRLASDRGVTPAAVALAWLLRHPARVLPVIGSTHPGHIRETTKALEVRLTREEWYRLTEAGRGERLP